MSITTPTGSRPVAADETTPTAPTTPPRMAAVVRHRYGTVDTVALEQLPVPEVGPDEVLLEVVAAGLDRGVDHLLTGSPYLLRLAGFGMFRPKQPVLGMDVAGIRVVAVGSSVTRLDAADGGECLQGGDPRDRRHRSLLEVDVARLDGELVRVGDRGTRRTTRWRCPSPRRPARSGSPTIRRRRRYRPRPSRAPAASGGTSRNRRGGAGTATRSAGGRRPGRVRRPRPREQHLVRADLGDRELFEGDRVDRSVAVSDDGSHSRRCRRGRRRRLVGGNRARPGRSSDGHDVLLFVSYFVRFS